MEHISDPIRARYRVTVYLAFLGIYSLVAYSASFSIQSNWTPLAVMASPGLAALSASLVTRRSLSEVGWRPGPLRFLLVGWLLPIGYATITYGTAWITGIGSIPSPLFLQRAALTLGLHNKTPHEIVLYAFAYIALMGLLNPFALTEELGWRGFLLPELNSWIGFRRAALVSGVVWAVWHWPVMLWGNYNVGTPLPYALLCLTAMVMMTAIVYAWVRLKSRSIWPCYLLHAAHNAMIQKFFDRITIESAYTKYFTTEFGIGLVVVTSLIAAFCWRRAEEVEARTPAESAASPYLNGNLTVGVR